MQLEFYYALVLLHYRRLGDCYLNLRYLSFSESESDTLYASSDDTELSLDFGLLPLEVMSEGGFFTGMMGAECLNFGIRAAFFKVLSMNFMIG